MRSLWHYLTSPVSHSINRPRPPADLFHVLVVDDDPCVRSVLQILLSADGCRVSTAADGINALEEFHACKPDLVIMDALVPGMDGFQTCRTMKQSSNVPVILFTGLKNHRSAGPLHESWTDAGADCCVGKHLDMRELRDRVRAIRGAAPPPSDPADHAVHPASRA